MNKKQKRIPSTEHTHTPVSEQAPVSPAKDKSVPFAGHIPAAVTETPFPVSKEELAKFGAYSPLFVKYIGFTGCSPYDPATWDAFLEWQAYTVIEFNDKFCHERDLFIKEYRDKLKESHKEVYGTDAPEGLGETSAELAWAERAEERAREILKRDYEGFHDELLLEWVMFQVQKSRLEYSEEPLP
jgi:hypothetical protein